MNDALPSSSDLFARLDRALRTWPASRAHAAGFGLWLPSDRAAVARAKHEATVAAARSLLETLRQPVVLMKGLEVAMVYPDPVRRPFRDVDVLSSDPETLWHSLVARGFWHRANRRFDIDHHHLPALKSPVESIAIEVHSRPNTPAWAHIPTDLLISTALPSRTGIQGVQRPRDDLHALLLAMHAWKGGFTRGRDLFDALLLASQSDRDVGETARQLGVGRAWAWTVRFAMLRLFDEGDRRTRTAARVLLPHAEGIVDRRRVRIVAPYFVANPVRVTKAHLAERRLGQDARRQPAPDGP